MLTRVASLLAAVATLAGVVTDAGAQVVAPFIVDVEGTAFRVTLADGRVLRSPELVGAVLGLRSGLRVRIDAVEEGRDANGGVMWLHTLSSPQSDGRWTNLCLAAPDGRQVAVPIPGRAQADGTIADAGPGIFEISCTAGAQAKCVRWGYDPLKRDLYNACIRMVRADYGGAGHATTRNGMIIDVYDPQKIQTPDLLAGQEFEAGWGPDGAVCVRHVRVKEHTSLDALEREYPHLRGRTGSVCTEEFASQHGAVIFNRSYP